MAKTKEELKELKQEVETVSRKLHELTDEELENVSGGVHVFLLADPVLEPAFSVLEHTVLPETLNID